MFATLIDFDSLFDQLNNTDLIIFDVRYDLMNKSAGREAYLRSHIPGAIYVDLHLDLSRPPAVNRGRHPLPDKKTEVLKSKKETKQNPSKDKKLQKKIKKIQENQKPNIEDTKVKQVSEFEKKEIFDPTNIAALIDKSKGELGETTKKTNINYLPLKNLMVNK